MITPHHRNYKLTYVFRKHFSLTGHYDLKKGEHYSSTVFSHMIHYQFLSEIIFRQSSSLII